MVSKNRFIELALSYAEVIQQPHFDKISFRVNKKIFCTIDAEGKFAVVKLSIIDQSVFCTISEKVIYPVKGKWGLQGWTMVELSKANEEIVIDALTTSYILFAPKRLSEKYI